MRTETLNRADTTLTFAIGHADIPVGANGEICLGRFEAIPPGEGREFLVAGEAIAVFRSRNGEFYATQALCPHRQGPLADGLLGGTTLICPFHGWKFDVATGRARTGDCNLQTFPVRATPEGLLWLTLSAMP